MLFPFCFRFQFQLTPATAAPVPALPVPAAVVGVAAVAVAKAAAAAVVGAAAIEQGESGTKVAMNHRYYQHHRRHWWQLNPCNPRPLNPAVRCLHRRSRKQGKRYPLASSSGGGSHHDREGMELFFVANGVKQIRRKYAEEGLK